MSSATLGRAAVEGNLSQFQKPLKPPSNPTNAQKRAEAEHKLTITSQPKGSMVECVCGRAMPAGLVAAHRPLCPVYGSDHRSGGGRDGIR